MEEIPTGKWNGKMEKKRLKCHCVFWLPWYRAVTMWRSNNADCVSGGDSVFATTASLSPILWCLILFVWVVISDKNQKIVQEQDLIWMEWHHTREANHSLQTRWQSGVLNTVTIWSLGNGLNYHIFWIDSNVPLVPCLRIRDPNTGLLVRLAVYKFC